MAWNDQYGGWNYGGGNPFPSRGSTDYLDQLRDLMMSNALASGRGARSAAMRSAGDDPSMAATYGLSSLMGGMSDASRGVASGRLQWMKGQQDLRKQMRLMKYQQKLQQGNPLMGALGSVGGLALGSWLAPGGWFGGGQKGINPAITEYLRYL